MQKHLLYINLLSITSALALGACADEVVNADTPEVPEVGEKTPIELNACYSDINGQQALTRAVITDGAGKTMKAFTEGTSLYMLMKSEHDVTENAGAPKVTRTIMFAVPQTDASKDYSEVNYSASNEYSKFVRYWDDTYARQAAISILAVCTPGMAPTDADGSADNKAWKIGGNDAGYVNRPWESINTGGGDTPYETIGWPVGNNPDLAKDQSGTFPDVDFITYQDLCYSNNIEKYDDVDPVYDNRLKFDFTKKKFKSGVLKFYHALSKLTFCFKEGEGFSEGQFAFKENTNVKLTNFYYKGTFNILNGVFLNSGSNTLSKGEISKIHQCDATATDYKYILDALVIPGTDLNTTEEAVTFTIYGNEYKLTMQQLYDAIRTKKDADDKYVYSNESGSNVKNDYLDNGKTLKAGVNYVFTFTVGKTQIKNISASIADWEEVTADEITPSNARITLNLEERNNADGTNVLGSGDAFSFYRASDNIPDESEINDDYTVYNWNTGYSVTTPTFVAQSGTTPAHWKTDWFWDNNKNFYHFRALCEDDGSSKKAVEGSLTNDATYGDYYSLSHCEKTSSASYKDILWGAPMLDKASNESNDDAYLKWHYGPMTKGFDSKEDGTVADALPSGTHHQIYKAIGPTENQIKLVLFHMMSDVTFKVKTTDTEDKVDLGNGTGTNVTTIELQKIHTSGKLFLGNGLVSGSTDNVANSNYTFSATPAPDNTTKTITWANYGAIPQDLTDVVLVITTPDHNQYKVKLWDPDHPIIATVTNKNIVIPYEASSTSDKYKINRWYPGFKYNYTFQLKKTGIVDISATVVDWENVVADDDTVVIE